jgi:hypothetical protein
MEELTESIRSDHFFAAVSVTSDNSDRVAVRSLLIPSNSVLVFISIVDALAALKAQRKR